MENTMSKSGKLALAAIVVLFACVAGSFLRASSGWTPNCEEAAQYVYDYCLPNAGGGTSNNVATAGQKSTADFCLKLARKSFDNCSEQKADK